VNPELGVIFLAAVAAVAAVLVMRLIFRLLRRVEHPTPAASGIEGILDLAASYVSHYLLAAIVLSPVLGMALGKPLLILLLPMLHFFASIVTLPAAFAAAYAGRRWLKRSWTRTRAWTAAVLTVVIMWLLSYVLVLGWDRPPDLLVHFLGEAPAAVAFVVSIPMAASSLALVLAWMMPSRGSRGTVKA
jgi:hypothetical protein